MKKKSVVLFTTLMLSMALSFTACGDKKPEEKEDRDRRTPTSVESVTDESTNVEADIKEDAEAVYTGSIYEYDESENPMVATLTIYDDSNCSLTERMQYSENTYNDYYYFCTYTLDDDKKTYSLTCELDAGDLTFFTISLNDKDEIVSVDESYSSGNEAEAIAGTYICEDDVYGHMELTVEADGSSYMRTEICDYSGTTYIFDDNWDFVGDNGYPDDSDEYETIDMFIFFSGNGFTYKDYRQATYEQYAGTYNLTGVLGDFTVDVDDYGNATCEVKVDGKKMKFNGNISFYESYESPDGYSLEFYLKNEDETYNLDIEINDFGNNTYNYYGTLSKVLSAG